MSPQEKEPHGIECPSELLEKADVLYVVPKFDGVGISGDEEWCEKILSLDKELALHGVTHKYLEFGEVRAGEYVNLGVNEFEECFGFTPTRFKPPHIKWSSENDWMKEDFEVDVFFNQVFHKVYHCDDTGVFSNRFVEF